MTVPMYKVTPHVLHRVKRADLVACTPFTLRLLEAAVRMLSMLCCAGRAMADGAGVLADGTAWERTSGEERAKNGFWLRWTSLRGVSSSGKVQSTSV